MIGVDEFYDILFGYCRAILNAETEEEALAIREEMPGALKELWGYDDVQTEAFMTRVDLVVEKLDGHEDLLEEAQKLTTEIISGNLTPEEANAILKEQLITETSQEQTPQNVQTNYGIAAGVGLALSVFIGAYVWKMKTLKNKKNKGL